MSVQFVWDDSYSVGREDIDNQHKRMFNLANQLPEEPGKARVKMTIMDLYKHTREHFEAEEAMMKQIGYPKLDEHRELHNEFISKLNDVSVQSFDNDQSVFAFKKLLYDWLIDHILHHDKNYFRFTQDQKLAHEDSKG